MRRSAALAGLSRDHHHALVVARQLYRARPQDAETAAERFVTFLAGHELAHFELEERVLLPALPDAPAAKELARTTRDQHARLRAAARRLQDRRDPPELAVLHEAGELLRDHVRMEEQELFPLVEESLDEAALEALGRRLREADRT